MIFKPSIGIHTDVLEHPEEYKVPVKLGDVIDGLTNKTVITLVFDPNCFDENGYHLCTYSNGSEDMIVMDSYHFPCYFKDPDVLEALLLHEVGHFSNGDYQNLTIEPSRIKRNRSAKIIHGDVQAHELAADRYAANIIGIPVMIRALDYLSDLRKKRKNDPLKDVALREFELRKKALLEMAKGRQP